MCPSDFVRRVGIRFVADARFGVAGQRVAPLRLNPNPRQKTLRRFCPAYGTARKIERWIVLFAKSLFARTTPGECFRSLLTTGAVDGANHLILQDPILLFERFRDRWISRTRDMSLHYTAFRHAKYPARNIEISPPRSPLNLKQRRYFNFRSNRSRIIGEQGRNCEDIKWPASV